MSSPLSLIDPALQRYVEAHSQAESPLLSRLRRETHLQVLYPQMLTDPVQGRLLAWWSRLVQPRHILEVGTFTGYSCLCLAEGLSATGRITTIELNHERAHRILRYVEEAGMKDRIQLLIGDAKDLIPLQKGPFDLVFLDGDKAHYLAYFEMIFPLLSPGGWLIADNVLWKGKVLHEPQDKETLGLQAFNDHMAQDPRVEVLMLPLRDGLSFIRKKTAAELHASSIDRAASSP